ncbi:MAG TPA: aminoglycoside phosphotransferase family protein [Burkholderiales bacterium]|nr:aminoglycoside phosphotransferase family protein [Burkholderiales bacterium]
MRPSALTDFLARSGLTARGSEARCENLAGGVSSDIWRVDLPSGPICVKRALPRLRVAQLWEAPIERNRYERMWLQSAAAARPGAVPNVLAWDDAHGLFAMEFLDYPTWKSVLRSGAADAAFAAEVGSALAAIHAATAGRSEIEAQFRTDAIFHAIRLEPYLVATAAHHADLRETLFQLVERTAAAKRCLVHGDVSPKNILVAPAGPVFLDAECAWYGDPAFDLAFCLNHLFLKCVWVPRAAEGFLACFDSLSRSYLGKVDWEAAAALEERTATLLPGLLLGRIDGKSPVEYLDEPQRARVREIARGFLAHPVSTLKDMRKAWRESLT